MSRNLCSSYCRSCGYLVKISDLRGKPVEFRRYGPYAPVLGVRFDCSCGQVYFASWSSSFGYWSREMLLSGAWKEPFLVGKGFSVPNTCQGKYAIETRHPKSGETYSENTGVFSIDLSYYETYNDEPLWDEVEKASIRNREREPWHLLKNNAEDVELVLGKPPTPDEGE